VSPSFSPRICDAHDAAHHFCVLCFWYVADEQNFLFGASILQSCAVNAFSKL